MSIEISVPFALSRRHDAAVFEHKGPLSQLDHTVSYAYSTRLLGFGREHSGAPDLEIHGPNYHPSSAESVVHYAMPLLT